MPLLGLLVALTPGHPSRPRSPGEHPISEALKVHRKAIEDTRAGRKAMKVLGEIEKLLKRKKSVSVKLKFNKAAAPARRPSKGKSTSPAKPSGRTALIRTIGAERAPDPSSPVDPHVVVRGERATRPSDTKARAQRPSRRTRGVETARVSPEPEVVEQVEVNSEPEIVVAPEPELMTQVSLSPRGVAQPTPGRRVVAAPEGIIGVEQVERVAPQPQPQPVALAQKASEELKIRFSKEDGQAPAPSEPVAKATGQRERLKIRITKDDVQAATRAERLNQTLIELSRSRLPDAHEYRLPEKEPVRVASDERTLRVRELRDAVPEEDPDFDPDDRTPLGEREREMWREVLKKNPHALDQLGIVREDATEQLSIERAEPLMTTNPIAELTQTNGSELVLERTGRGSLV